MIVKDFKTKDNRIINVSIIDEKIIFKSGLFLASYLYNDIDLIIKMHSKILNEKTLNNMRDFINKYCEHIKVEDDKGQMSLF